MSWMISSSHTQRKSAQHLVSGMERRPTPPWRPSHGAEILESGRKILAQLDAVVRDMETGDGNVGQMVRGEQMYWSKVTEFQRAIHAAGNKDTLTGRLIFDETYYDKLHAKRSALADLQAGKGSAGKLLERPGAIRPTPQVCRRSEPRTR